MDISIVILSYNGLSEYLAEILDAVFTQRTKHSCEILVIDSGSVDGTVEYLKNKKEIRLHQLPNSGFGHGKTRQLGVDLTKGKYVVFLTQDATPQNKLWLESLIEKLESRGNIAAVSSRILPRADAGLLKKINTMSEWCSGREDFEVSLKDKNGFFRMGPDKVREHLKLHNVSSAYKRDFLERFKFDDVPFGEDALIAKKALENGYSLAYSASSVVLHSHDYELIKTYKRNVIDGKFNKEYLNRPTIDNIFKLLSVTLKFVKNDISILLRDENAKFPDKAKQLLYSPAIHFAEMSGQYIGNTRR